MADATGLDRSAAVGELEAEFAELLTHFRRMLARNANLVSPGLLPATYKALTTISRCGEATITGLAERMVIDKGQLSRSIRELEALGLVRRTPDPNDGRVWKVSLTEHGAERLKAARLPQESMLKRSVSNWSDEDLRNLTRLLSELRKGSMPNEDAPA